MGFSSDLTRLHYFISSSGGVERAALRLNVYPSTLSKILDGREVSAYAKSKVEKAIGPITQPKSPRALQLPESDFIAQIKAFISDCGSLAGAGLRLGLRSSTLEKFLTGKVLSAQVKRKIERIVCDKSLSKSSKPYPHSMVEKLNNVHELYKNLGTLEAVGRKLSVTRERVRQMLVKGTRLGLYEYKPYDYPYIPKEKVVGDYIDSLSLNEVARINQISSGYLRKLLTAYSITEKELRVYGLEGRKKRCIGQYYKIVDRLGHHPTTTELQKPSESRSLWARISRLWGSFDAFRKELNIPQPPRVHPHWLEPRLQVAFIARMQHLDTIRECLSAANPMTVSEIAVACSFSHNRVRRLLTLLMAAGEVQRVGISSSTKYLLLTN